MISTDFGGAGRAGSQVTMGAVSFGQRDLPACAGVARTASRNRSNRNSVSFGPGEASEWYWTVKHRLGRVTSRPSTVPSIEVHLASRCTSRAQVVAVDLEAVVLRW